MATNYTENLPVPQTVEEFWSIADDTRLADEFASDSDLKYLKLASFDVVKDVCFHYRFFTKYYINDLAHMISRLPFGEFKTYMGTVLNDELGNGDPTRTHLQIYDDFLETLGYPNEAEHLDSIADPRIVAIAEELSELTRTRSTPYIIGLRGMGAECLCQVYLTRMYENILANPEIARRKDSIDWRFWDFHAGEADIVHREETRRLINEYMINYPESVPELGEGYFKGRAAWKDYWDIAYEKYEAKVKAAVASSGP